MTLTRLILRTLPVQVLGILLITAPGCGKSSEPAATSVIVKELKAPADDGQTVVLDGPMTVKVRFAEPNDKWRAITARAKKITLDRSTCRIEWRMSGPDEKWDNGDKKYPEMIIPAARLISLEYETEKPKDDESARK